MPTVIDALVVELELDATPYQRSWKDVDAINDAAAAKQDREQKKRDKAEKERQRREKEGAQNRKKYLDDASNATANFARTLAATFLGFESIKGGLSFLGNLNGNQAQLGRASARIGVATDELNTYGKAVELAGGKTEDVVSTFGRLAQEFSTFKISGGTPGPLLQLLTQKGVAFRDAKGNLREMGAIFDELAKKTENMNDQDRANLFTQAGISAGVINRLLEESSLRDKQLAQAKELNAVNAASVKRAEDLASAWSRVGASVQKMGSGLLDIGGGKTTGLLDAVADYFSTGHVSNKSERELFGGAGDDERALAARTKYNQMLIDRITRERAAQGGDGLVAPKAGTVAGRNNNPGNIKAVGNQPADAQGFRIFATLAEGQAAMRAQVERDIARGNDTIYKLIRAYEGTDTNKFPEATAAYIARASKLTGKGANDKLSPEDITKLLNAMTIVESALPDSAMRLPPSLATPGIAGNGSAGSAAAAGGGKGDVHVTIGQQTINAPSADPRAVADQVGDATARKVMVSQANQGQT